MGQEREGTSDKTGVGKTKDDGAATVPRKSPVSTRMERMPPTKRTPPVTINERAMCTRNPQSGGAEGVDGRYNARRSGAPGPHSHLNVARQVVDDRRPEVRGQ